MISRLMILTVGLMLGIGAAASSNPTLTPGVWTDIGFAGGCNYKGAYSVAVDPTNPSVIYAWACKLYKTTDRGTSWRQIGKVASGAGAPVGQFITDGNHLRIDPENTQHLYTSIGVNGGTMGFWVSTDGGETWTKPQSWSDKGTAMGATIDDTYDVAVDPTDFDHVLVTFHSCWGWTDSKWNGNSGVLESKDGGQTWIAHDPISGSGSGHGIWFLYNPKLGIGNSNTWLIGIQGNGFWRTTDSGTNWTKVSDRPMTHGGGQIYYTSTGVLYATGAPMQRSTDNGIHWASVGPNQGFIGIIGDGNRMYAKAHDMGGPIVSALESNGTSWTDYSPQPQSFTGGCYEYDIDKTNGIIYGAYLGGSLMALKIQNYTPVQIKADIISPASSTQKIIRMGTITNGHIAMRLSALNGKVVDIRGKMLMK